MATPAKGESPFWWPFEPAAPFGAVTSSWTSEGTTSWICCLMRRVYSAPDTLIRETPEYRSSSRRTSERIATPGPFAGWPWPPARPASRRRPVELEPDLGPARRGPPAVGQAVDQEQPAPADLVGVRARRHGVEPGTAVGHLDAHPG